MSDIDTTEILKSIPNEVFAPADDITTRLVETGETGAGPDFDATLIATQANQDFTSKGGGLQDLIADIQGTQIPEIRQKRMEQLEVATQNKQLTPAQAIAAAVLQMAPIIVGLTAGGKTGGAQGAAIGAQGSVGLLNNIGARNDRESALALQQANQLGQQEKGLLQQAGSFQGLQARQEFQGEQNELNRESQERARAAARVSGFESPAIGEGFAKLMNGSTFEELSPSEQIAITSDARARSHAIALEREGGTQERFATRDQREQAERAVFGAQIIPNARPSQKQSDQADKIISDLGALTAAADGLEESISKNGVNFIQGERALQDQLTSQMFSELRKLAGTGANFTGNERELITRLLPPNASEDGFFGTLKKEFIQGDPTQVIRDLKRLVQISAGQQLLPKKFVLEDPAAYSKADLTKLLQEGVDFNQRVATNEDGQIAVFHDNTGEWEVLK